MTFQREDRKSHAPPNLGGGGEVGQAGLEKPVLTC